MSRHIDGLPFIKGGYFEMTREDCEKTREVLRSTYITVHGGDCAHLNYDHAIEMAVKALEKQIPKKPIQREFESYARECFDFYYICPTCGKKVEVDDNEAYATEYYPSCECGQRIKWDGILAEFEMKWKEADEIYG